MAKKAQLDAVRPVLDAANETIDKIEGALDVIDKVTDKGADAVETGLEKVADVVPDVLDTSVHVSTKGIRRIVESFRNPKVAFFTVTGLSMVAGAGLGYAGYRFMKKRLELQYQELLDEKLNEESIRLREFYIKRNKEGKFSTPEGAAEELLTKEAVAALKNYQGAAISTEQQTIEEVASPSYNQVSEMTIEDRRKAMKAAGYTEVQIAEVLGVEVVGSVDIQALQARMRSGTPVKIEEDSSNNVFVEGRALRPFDYEYEILNRNPEEPYTITHDEFNENEDDRPQHNLTYYNGDDVLVDDQDMPIPDIEEMVGSENLTKFGYGSNNRNVVYVRNEKSNIDFEITLSEGKFGDEVAGLKHSAPPLRRFREGDDG